MHLALQPACATQPEPFEARREPLDCGGHRRGVRPRVRGQAHHQHGGGVGAWQARDETRGRTEQASDRRQRALEVGDRLRRPRGDERFERGGVRGTDRRAVGRVISWPLVNPPRAAGLRLDERGCAGAEPLDDVAVQRAEACVGCGRGARRNGGEGIGHGRQVEVWRIVSHPRGRRHSAPADAGREPAPRGAFNPFWRRNLGRPISGKAARRRLRGPAGV